MQGISQYTIDEKAARAKAHADYIAHPNYPYAVSEAKSRGFRHATLDEINRSAEGKGNCSDLYSWKGGLWVKEPDAKSGDKTLKS